MGGGSLLLSVLWAAVVVSVTEIVSIHHDGCVTAEARLVGGWTIVAEMEGSMRRVVVADRSVAISLVSESRAGSISDNIFMSHREINFHISQMNCEYI